MVVFLHDLHLSTWHFMSFLLLLPYWMRANLQTYTAINVDSHSAAVGSRNTWDLRVSIQESLLPSMWKIGFFTECIDVFAPNQSLFLQQVSWCRICTSLPREKFMWLSAHIQMVLEWIRYRDCNWAGTFRSVWGCCCIPGREVEYHSFQAAVSVILAQFCAELKIYII